MSGTETYTYNAPMFPNQKWGTLVRASDGAFVPCDPANRDFQSYLDWLDDRNPAPEGAPTRADFP